MNVTIFGATGQTGKHLVAQALDAGYQVTAFARSPEKLGPYQDRVRIVQGDVQNTAAVEEAVAGADAVLSVLGPTENSPDYQVTRGTAYILQAMEKHGVRRLIISAGAGVAVPEDEPTLFNKLIVLMLKLFSRHVYEDMKRVVALVRKSDVDWTIVRVPRLTEDGPQIDEARDNVKVGYVGKGIGVQVSRADLATFMLHQLKSEAYVRMAPAISN